MSGVALDVQVEEEAFLVNGEPWRPVIYDGSLESQDLAGYNAATVKLCAGTRSDLDWASALDQARVYKEQGLRILWELDFGLFSDLSEPLAEQGQFQALVLSLRHFTDTVWPEFAEVTLGACVYRGSADFTADFQWSPDQEALYSEWCEDHGVEGHQRIFCRDACVHYLELLAARLPDECQAFVFLDLSGITCPWERLLIQSRDQFPYLHRALFPFQKGEVALAWRDGRSPLGLVGGLDQGAPEEARVGLCVPRLEAALQVAQTVWAPILEELNQGAESFRLVPESEIITSWQGLDVLVVFESTIDFQCRRMLQGFEAAGGKVRYV